MRLGILGGTFDPIHFGHLRLAEEVGEELNLEKVYLIPAAIPPHKERRPITPFSHRLKMIELAVRESPILEVLDLEGRRQGLSYSIETLQQFHQLFGSELDLYFILGIDAFLEIETWKDFRRLFNYAHFVVIQRPGVSAVQLKPFLTSLGLDPKEEDQEDRFVFPSGHSLIYLAPTLMDISSTAIRKKASGGKSIRFLVPDAVRSYIIKNELLGIHGGS